MTALAIRKDVAARVLTTMRGRDFVGDRAGRNQLTTGIHTSGRRAQDKHA